MEVDNPHLMYVISTEVNNEGMKYTDAFYVATRFCMVQRDAGHSSLRISAEIRYIKNVNGIARGKRILLSLLLLFHILIF
jgi:hypothetical protein